MKTKDQKIIETVDRMLAEDKTWEEIASCLHVPLGTLHTKVRRLGYKTGKRLVPIHAPSLEDSHAA